MSEPDERSARPGHASEPADCEHIVLLVEDDVALRELITRALFRDGYEVVAVADGEQALDWLGLCLFDGSLEHAPAAIVSDIRLPNFSGLELLEGLLCAAVEIPVVLMTGFPSEETYAAALELGAAHVLAKPFDVAELRSTLANLVDSPARKRRPLRREAWLDEALRLG
jgi:DNA-binding response OmpR family regulator